MNEALLQARTRAAELRFTGDTPLSGQSNGPTVDQVLASVSSHALRLTPSVLPALWARWKHTCEMLSVPTDAAVAFVHAEPRPMADVFTDEHDRCVIRFSSGLIGLLDEDEMMFVAAHELGHFLLGHGSQAVGDQFNSVEQFMLQRAAEISVDRIGLRACEAVDTCVRAMMKIMSGLGDSHLRFDVSAFLAQTEGEVTKTGVFDQESTHPSLVVRTRALLWFEMTGAHAISAAPLAPKSREKLDARIQADLSRFVDGPVRERIREAAAEVAMWLAAAHIAAKGTFTKHDQQGFASEFGSDVLEKFKRFASELQANELRATVDRKLDKASETLRMLIPRGFEAEMNRIGLRVTRFVS